MHNFRKLKVYTLAKDLVKNVYLMIDTLPSKENYALCDQLRRAVISVPSNIAEGLGRSTSKDKGHFMQIAYGSLMEVLAQVDIACDLGYISQEQFQKLEELIVEESKLLHGMINNFKEKIKPLNNYSEHSERSTAKRSTMSIANDLQRSDL